MAEAPERERWDGWLGPRQWMPILGILSVAVIALAVLLFLNTDDAGADDANGPPVSGVRPVTHEHADFAVVIRGEMFDFGQPQFLSDTEGNELSQHAHIHERRFTLVHVHSTLTTWDEFFRSVGFQLTDPTFSGVTSERTCMVLPDETELCNTETERWSFIANGVPVDGMALVNIGDLDRILFSYGPETPEEALERYYGLVTDQACIPSVLCVDRIPADEPPETCSGRGQCTR